MTTAGHVTRQPTEVPESGLVSRQLTLLGHWTQKSHLTMTMALSAIHQKVGKHRLKR